MSPRARSGCLAGESPRHSWTCPPKVCGVATRRWPRRRSIWWRERKGRPDIRGGPTARRPNPPRRPRAFGEKPPPRTKTAPTTAPALASKNSEIHPRPGRDWEWPTASTNRSSPHPPKTTFLRFRTASGGRTSAFPARPREFQVPRGAPGPLPSRRFTSAYPYRPPVAAGADPGRRTFPPNARCGA